MTPSTALLTDRYELTMLQAALADGTAQRRCIFEVFTRRLPHGRRYGVLAGTGRVLEALAAFRFGDAELAWLADERVVDEPTLAWLADYRFTGDIVGYAEGEVFFPLSRPRRADSVFRRRFGASIHRDGAETPKWQRAAAEQRGLGGRGAAGRRRQGGGNGGGRGTRFGT